VSSRNQAVPAPVELAVEGSSLERISPLGLAAEYIEIDVATVRWLWWPIILYLFWGMAFVCDEFFVKTITVISTRFSIPDDVAGATLMALGCNGPEMSLNTIAIFHPSPVGVGAVVGGEVFNVLVIIGAAVLATPDMYLPVKLVSFCFFRDVIFYLVSVGVLYWVLRDGQVSRLNSAVLLFGAVCYTLTVIFSGKIREFWNKEAKIVKAATKRFTVARFSARLGSSLLPPVEDDDSDAETQADPETIEAWSEAKHNTNPETGTVLSVRIDMHNRMMDRNHPLEPRYMFLTDDALVVSTVMDPVGDEKDFTRTSTTIAFDYDEPEQPGGHWHHGGLVNQPSLWSNLERPKEETKPGIVDVPGFREAPWEVIPLDDVLFCQWSGKDHKHFNLHVHHHDSNLGKLVTLELSSDSQEIMENWVSSVRKHLLDQRRKTTDAPPARTLGKMLGEWAHWIQFPVEFFVTLTIPDMDDPKLQHLYPLSFTMSMVWLAIFAFSVVTACDGIHADFGISEDILGFTLAAAGTSFPNVFSGMCVAKQGKTSMAVANALGANVQNVFLALAVPWFIQSWFIAHGPFPMPVQNLFIAVLECVITLMPVLIIYIAFGFSMPRWSGWVYLLTYVAYVICALGQQTTGCSTWPFGC